MQKLLDKESMMEKKNLLLQPVFRDLKSQIKHMSYTEEYRVMKEYLNQRNQIIDEFVIYSCFNKVSFREKKVLQGSRSCPSYKKNMLRS